MSRKRRVASKKALDVKIDELVVRGYSIKSRGESSARLKATGWGDSATHLLLAALTLWWTLGLANALYAVYARATAEEIVIIIDE